MTTLFFTRDEAREAKRLVEFNEMIARRPDLKRPPHSWRAMRPVKVIVTVATDS